MFECKVCGLLSLGGTSCPACGSQLRNDLSKTMLADGDFPTEVPGLDEAAESWYELEGIDPPAHVNESASKSVKSESLPFGFQGESNVVSSRLPFGIGSYAAGIPFDSGGIVVTGQEDSIQSNTQSSAPLTQDVSNEVPERSTSHPAPTAEPSSNPPPQQSSNDAAPPVVSPSPELSHQPIVDLPEMPETVVSNTQKQPLNVPSEPTNIGQGLVQPVRLDSARLVTAPEVVESSPEVPEYWKIDAGVPNYDEIYSQDEEIIEVTYDSLDDDVLVYDHESDSPAAVFYSPLEAAPVAQIKPVIQLKLHPIMAMDVDIKNHPELGDFLSAGFDGLQQRSWVQAARSFQKIAAKMPEDPYVFNNYGISLLQRALDLKASSDAHQQSMANAQFESAILALREAAKNAPTEGEILLNLAHALIESGRSEKALGIMNVHNLRHPDSTSGLNTAAVAMFHLGQLSQAMDTLRKASNDPIAKGNLLQFTKAN